MKALEPKVYLKIELGSGNNSTYSSPVHPPAALAAHGSKKLTMTSGGGPVKADFHQGNI